MPAWQTKNGREAIKTLAQIAVIEACGNSEPDVMARELDGAIGRAQRFFKDQKLNLSEWVE